MLTNWFSGTRRKPVVRTDTSKGRYDLLLQKRIEIEDEDKRSSHRGRKMSLTVGYSKPHMIDEIDVAEAFADPRRVLHSFRSVKIPDEVARNRINASLQRVSHPDELVPRQTRDQFMFDLRLQVCQWKYMVTNEPKPTEDMDLEDFEMQYGLRLAKYKKKFQQHRRYIEKHRQLNEQKDQEKEDILGDFF
jgi:hypothetical protein